MPLNFKNKLPNIRYLNDMRDILYDQKWAAKAPNMELYYMYRGINKKDDLRYDITIIPPKMLGKEFVKTKGHYHIGSFGEIYIVLQGKAIYLMQKTEKNRVVDVFAVKAKKGDVVLIPPDYGHITINPSKKEELKTANWVSIKCRSDYKPIEKMGGGCWFYTAGGWVKNKNYKKIPELRFEKPRKTMPKSLNLLK
jgi:glucose-6-phosphate isomerase